MYFVNRNLWFRNDKYCLNSFNKLKVYSREGITKFHFFSVDGDFLKTPMSGMGFGLLPWSLKNMNADKVYNDFLPL